MKRILSIILAATMMCTTMISAHWADADLQYLVEKGVIASEDELLQHPDQPITRMEIVQWKSFE